MCERHGMPAPRVVLDTNIFVSALLGKGSSRQLYGLFKDGRITLISSNLLLGEVADVLLRPKLAIPPEEVKEAFRLLRYHAVIVRSFHSVTDCRDSKDNLVLECALAGKADYIVTGDYDLQIMDPWREIRIISPSVFLKRFVS